MKNVLRQSELYTKDIVAEIKQIEKTLSEQEKE